MQRLYTFFTELWSDQRGLTTVEYAIILCVIVSVAATTWDSFGEALHEKLLAATEEIINAL